jgi:tetratricopeptide (TPR) repeat protein
MRELPQAEALFREALDVQRQVRTRPHVDTAELLAGLGDVLASQGRLADAAPLLREALSEATQSLPPGHWRLGAIESALGACQWRLGRHQGSVGRLVEKS